MTRLPRHLPLLLLWLSALLSSADAAERRVALVIGNAAYEEITPLENPVNDATDVAALLEKRLGFETLLYADLDGRGMDDAVDEFEKIAANAGIRLFFFAGHGISVDGTNYLVPVDADIRRERDVKYEAFDAGRILDMLRGTGNGVNILIFDACRNNPIRGSSRSTTRGLSRMSAPVGSLLLYATAPNDVARDGEGRNGTFTKHLLEHLPTPGDDLDDLVRKVRKGVKRETNDEQVPWNESSLSDEIYLAERPDELVATTDSSPIADGAFDFIAEATDVDAVRSIACARDERATGDKLKREAEAVFFGLYEHRDQQDRERGWRLFLEAIENCSTSAMETISKTLLKKKECYLAGEYAQLAVDHGHAVARRLLNQIRNKPNRACTR